MSLQRLPSVSQIPVRSCPKHLLQIHFKRLSNTICTGISNFFQISTGSRWKPGQLTCESLSKALPMPVKSIANAMPAFQSPFCHMPFQCLSSASQIPFRPHSKHLTPTHSHTYIKHVVQTPFMHAFQMPFKSWPEAFGNHFDRLATPFQKLVSCISTPFSNALAMLKCLSNHFKLLFKTPLTLDTCISNAFHIFAGCLWQPFQPFNSISNALPMPFKSLFKCPSLQCLSSASQIPLRTCEKKQHFPRIHFKCLSNAFQLRFERLSNLRRKPLKPFQLPCDFFSKALLMPSNSFFKFPWHALQLPLQIIIESAKCLSSCFQILR